MYSQTTSLVWVLGPFCDIYWAGTRTYPFSFPPCLPFLPVNQTGVKRSLISPLSGWQYLGDRLLWPTGWCSVPSPASAHPVFPCSVLLRSFPSLTLSSLLYQSFLKLLPLLCHHCVCTPPPTHTFTQPQAFPPWPVSSSSSLFTLLFPSLHWALQSHQRELISELLPG